MLLMEVNVLNKLDCLITASCKAESHLTRFVKLLSDLSCCLASLLKLADTPSHMLDSCRIKITFYLTTLTQILVFWTYLLDDSVSNVYCVCLLTFCVCLCVFLVLFWNVVLVLLLMSS